MTDWAFSDVFGPVFGDPRFVERAGDSPDLVAAKRACRELAQWQAEWNDMKRRHAAAHRARGAV